MYDRYQPPRPNVLRFGLPSPVPARSGNKHVCLIHFLMLPTYAPGPGIFLFRQATISPSPPPMPPVKTAVLLPVSDIPCPNKQTYPDCIPRLAALHGSETWAIRRQ